ncbi:hypothetical protein [Streptomyces sirii]
MRARDLCDLAEVYTQKPWPGPVIERDAHQARMMGAITATRSQERFTGEQ